MVGSDILLFPDTGPEFHKALRLAALYCKRVYVISLRTEAPIDNQQESLDNALCLASGYRTSLEKRASDYVRFYRDHARDLGVLRSEGILQPLGATRTGDESAMSAFRQEFCEFSNRIKPSHHLRALGAALGSCPPSWFDYTEYRFAWMLALGRIHSRFFLEMNGPSGPAAGQDLEELRRILFHLDSTDSELLAALDRLADACGPKPDLRDPKVSELFDLLIRDQLRKADPLRMFMSYLLVVALHAETKGLGLLTWSPQFRDALWRCRTLFSRVPAIAAGKGRRQMAKTRLGQMILEDHVPSIEQLPLDEVLEIRHKRSAEMERFWVGLGALAAQLDLAQSSSDLELQIQDVVAKHVGPALVQLRAAVEASKADIFSKLASSNKALAAATVPLAFGHAYGPPLDSAGLLATLGSLAGIAGPIILDSIVQQQAKLRGSEWALVFRLRKHQDHHTAYERRCHDPFSVGP
jgi:hypothetical protein